MKILPVGIIMYIALSRLSHSDIIFIGDYVVLCVGILYSYDVRVCLSY